MRKLKLKTNPGIERRFTDYPQNVREKMQHLRALVLETAEEEGIAELEETLKWGEPSFVTKNGSTLRMDWKEENARPICNVLSLFNQACRDFPDCVRPEIPV